MIQQFFLEIISQKFHRKSTEIPRRLHGNYRWNVRVTCRLKKIPAGIFEFKKNSITIPLKLQLEILWKLQLEFRGVLPRNPFT